MDELSGWHGRLGAASLTSETAFSSNYPSIWRTLTPMMDLFVRRMNQNGYERQFTPLKSKIDPSRRGVINEAANRFLSNAKAPTSLDLASASWLIRDHAITVLPSVASLTSLRRTGKPSSAVAVKKWL